MKILGMNVQHDGGCCLLVDGKIACAVSEERVSRQRGAAGWWSSMRYCLETTRLTLPEIDLAVFSSYGEDLPKDFDGGLSSFGLPRGRSAVIDHHLSHAACAYWNSTFPEALVVVLDGTGNGGDTESYYVCRGTSIERIGGNSQHGPGRGIGKTYEAFTSFLGWPMVDSGTTMALAALGDPSRYKGLEIFEVKKDQVNSRLPGKYVQGVLDFSQKACADFGAPFDRGAQQISRDVARFIQDRTEEALVELIGYLVGITGIKAVCLAGGVALNCVANERIRKLPGVDSVFISPVASDKGQAMGNALYGAAILCGNGRPAPLARDSFGRTYPREEILRVLEKRQELGNNFIVEAPPIEFTHTNSIGSDVAQLLSEGKTVGWVQGGSEMGSRALGHRSILADPRRADIQARLNDKVKRRLWFRPYAPSVLAEDAGGYFDLDIASPFMALAPQVHKSRAHSVPGVVHVDGTSRPQTVSQEAEPLFYQMIQEFRNLTRTPLVLNTSFNVSGEPIVETPYDAMSAFLRTGLDVLAVEDFLVWKRRPQWEVSE